MRKNRIKLTALAVSALMALEIVPSAVWAADLFSDGLNTGQEVLFESSEAEVSEAEATEAVMAEESPDSAGSAAKDITGVNFHYSGDSVVVDFSVSNEDGTSTPFANQPAVKGAGGNLIRPATCYTPETAVYSFSYNGYTVLSTNGGVSISTDCQTWTGADGEHAITAQPGAFTEDSNAGWIICTPGSKSLSGKYGHDDLEQTEKVTISPTCEPGEKVVYLACKTCGKITTGAFAEKDPTAAEIKEYIQSAGNGTVYDANGDGKLDNGDFQLKAIDANGHKYDDTKPVTVTEEYYAEHAGELPESCRPYNCRWAAESGGTGKMVACDSDDPDTEFIESADKDAYYSLVLECVYCHKPAYFKKVTLRDASGHMSGIYYEQQTDGNIEGFAAVRNGRKVVIRFGADEYDLDGDGDRSEEVTRINQDLVLNPAVPVLTNCSKLGYYMVRTYESDTNGPVAQKQVEVNKGHVWGNTEVARGTEPGLGATETEDAKLLANTTNNGSNGFDVVRDENGDVTEAKSLNCATVAKYQLYHQCLSPSCGAKEKVGDVQETKENTDMHQWGEWKDPVDSDNKYYPIEGDSLHHRKFTYQNRVCTLCGKRDLQLYGETEEEHTLVKTKYDNEGEDETYVAPTCGKDGSYDVIMRCPCGYEDESTRKSTAVPKTDKHDFGDNPVEIQIVGNIQIGGRVPSEPETKDPSYTVYAQVVRKCTVCGEYDSNGIEGVSAGELGYLAGSTNGAKTDYPSTDETGFGPSVIIDTTAEGRTFTDYEEAEKDPVTHLSYPCSVEWITVNFSWTGNVDGEAQTLTASKTVPYYSSETAYTSASPHRPGKAKVENEVKPTTEAPGSYDSVVYCTVCGAEISRKEVTVAQLGKAPDVTAKPVDYNTVRISWTEVEGAERYKLYYKSSNLGISKWKLLRSATGTSCECSGLVTGAKYRFTVKAVIDGAEGEYSKKGAVAAPKLKIPKIKKVAALANGRNKITWSRIDGATGYIIQRNTGKKWVRVGTVKKGAMTYWVDKKPVLGATYKVRAYRFVNNINFSKNVYSGFSSAE